VRCLAKRPGFGDGDPSISLLGVGEGKAMGAGATPEQLTIVQRFGSVSRPPVAGEKVGIARNVRQNLVPLNGFRHPVAGDTSGWYIWAGDELPQDDEFFVPLHIEHLREWCPAVIPYLALAPGWRFLLAPGQEDVWFDASLLDL
jgi:hypothetical protein